jgi:hypothetical protein
VGVVKDDAERRALDRIADVGRGEVTVVFLDMRVSACPRTCASTISGAPAITRCDAQVWRKQWKLACGSIHAAALASATRRT